VELIRVFGVGNLTTSISDEGVARALAHWNASPMTPAHRIE
jgi:hypothetical protein